MLKAVKGQNAVLSKLPEKDSFEHLPEKRIINGYKRYKVEASSEREKRDLVRRIEASFFKLGKIDLYGYPLREGTLKKPLSVINSSNTLHTLDINLASRDLAGSRFDSIWQSIRGRTSLKNLNVHFGDLPETRLEKFCAALKSLSSLQTLSLSFINRSMNDEKLSKISQALKALGALRKIHLNLDGCEKITSVGIYSLRKGLRRFRFLKVLTLDLYGCIGIDKDGLKSLNDTLKTLISLQSLNIDFRNTSITKKQGESVITELESLNEGVKSLVSLRNIRMNFYEHEKTAKISIENLSPTLETLCLEFSHWVRLKDAALSHFGESLKRLNSLKTIDLNFFSCSSITDTGVLNIGQGLKLLPSLQTIRLDFSKCNFITDQGVNHLGQELKSLDSLQIIHLNFSGCSKIADPGFKTFSHSLGQLIHLKDLNLNFSECRQITDGYGIGTLCLYLEDLTSLQSLSLNFSGLRDRQHITLEGRNHLGRALKRMTLLKSLHLEFEWCQEISKEGMKNLCSGLKNRTSLKSLGLNFSFCGLKQEILDVLWITLKTLTWLEKIELNLYSSQRRFYLDENAYCETFKSLVSLRDVCIGFPSCDESHLVKFGETLKALCSLERVYFRYKLVDGMTVEPIKNLKKTLMTLPYLKNLEINTRYG